MGALLVATVNKSTITFAVGLGLTIREALLRGPERPSLYILFAGMMGLPMVWAAQAGQRTPTKRQKP